jgi:integrase/recombinase XerD
MPAWPDKEEALLVEFMNKPGGLPSYGAGRRSALRDFQRFAANQKAPLSVETLSAWVNDAAGRFTVRYVIRRGVFVAQFLHWLVQRGAAASNPIAELLSRYNCRSTSAVLRALLAPDSAKALEGLRRPPRYASHLGAHIQGHVERMRCLGYAFRNEDKLVRFDRYLQEYPDAANLPFGKVARDYIASAPSASEKVQRLSVARVVAGALQRAGLAAVKPVGDRLVRQEMGRARAHPYIYTKTEVQKLLRMAGNFESSKHPLRAAALRCMIGLAYCAGLRISELLGLRMSDVRLAEGTIDIRGSKFFKSRCLPLSSSAVNLLRDYAKLREQAGAPAGDQAALFCHGRKGYSRAGASHLLRIIIQRAGLKPAKGRGGARIHDLRHTFVVHRMTQWYQGGINPEGRLAHLAAYLGHRDINSTLVYLTITQELLQQANRRFRVAESTVVDVIRGKA